MNAADYRYQWCATDPRLTPRSTGPPFVLVGRDGHVNYKGILELSDSDQRGHIDSTPVSPRPPQSIIDAAERDIPSILADVQVNHVGRNELVASSLAYTLRKSYGHNLAAAEWAIHASVLAGRLSVDLVPYETPTVYKFSGSSRNMFGVGSLGGAPKMEKVAGGYHGYLAIPFGRPTPFDCFKVFATVLLWEWWRTRNDVPLTPTALAASETHRPNAKSIEEPLATLHDVDRAECQLALHGSHEALTKLNVDVPTETDRDKGQESKKGFLGGSALAEALGVHPTRREAFFRQLERLRKKLGDDCWHEIREPRPNSPRFLYKADSINLKALAKDYSLPKSST